MELEAPLDVVGRLRDRLVRLARQRALASLARRLFGDLVHDAPQPAQEADDPLDHGLRPLHVLVGRAQEEDVEPHRVGAVLATSSSGPDDVALRLRHLRAAHLHPALVEQARERLAEAEHPQVVHRLDEEARVEQVAGRVVDAADVLRDGQPVVDDGAVERRLVVVRVDVAQEVPGRVDEGVHRVRLAPPLLAAARAGDAHPLLVGGERRAPLRLVVLDLGQQHRQLVLGHGHDAAALAVDDRDRAAPVALPREAPVAQPVRDGRRAAPLLREPVDDRALGLVGRQPVERARVDQPPVLVDHLDDRQLERLGELAVALVVRRHGHDRAGAVVHQHVVGDPDRQPLAVDRVGHVVAGEDAGLRLLGGAVLGAPRAGVLRVCLRLLARMRSTNGCSGATTKNVAPNSVSGRVVKTGMSRSSSSTRKRISAPSERPIQLRWIVFVRSGH